MQTLIELARSSGRNPENLRRLARAGKIPVGKLGRDWVLRDVDAGEVRMRRRRGRPLSAANAWGLLALLSDQRPTWVDARIRYRLNRYLESPQRVQALLELSGARAEVRLLWLPPEDLPALGGEPGLVLTGLAAAGPPDFDLFYFQPVVDAYLDQERLKAVMRRYQPIANAEESNVVLRVPTHRWVLDSGGTAPRAVVAADLLNQPDERARDAGREALARLITRG